LKRASCEKIACPILWLTCNTFETKLIASAAKAGAGAQGQNEILEILMAKPLGQDD